ncbi:hypothetical protein BC629DRAFT_1443694 [Irpex lacteus]|nr:hypothetical protein BC629DRAFT_1443694 [Irpex lacteus]
MSFNLRTPLSSNPKGEDIDSGKINQRVTYRKNLAVPRVLRNAAIPDEADRLCYSMAEGREVVPFWVAQDITELESAIPAIKENKSRFIHRTNNIKRQHCLIHVMFLARNDDPPLRNAVHLEIYGLRLPSSFFVQCMAGSHAIQKEIIALVTLYWNGGFFVYTLVTWLCNGPWRKVIGGGIRRPIGPSEQCVESASMVGDLGSEDMARFLHAVLPLFLPRERRVGAITGAGSVSRSSLQSEGPGPEPSIDSGIRSQSPPSLSRSTTLSLFTAVQHGGNLISTPKNVGGYIASTCGDVDIGQSTAVTVSSDADHEEEERGHVDHAEHDEPKEHEETAEHEQSFVVYEKTEILPPIPKKSQRPWKVPAGFNYLKCIPCKDAERSECYQAWSKNTPRRCLHCSRYLKKCTFTVWSAEELKWPDKRRIANIRADKRPDELKGSSSEPCDASNTRAEEPEGPPHRSRLSPLAKKLGEMCNPWPGEPSKTLETRLVDVIAALISSKRAWLQDMFNEKEMYKRLKDYVYINSVEHCRAL